MKHPTFKVLLTLFSLDSQPKTTVARLTIWAVIFTVAAVNGLAASPGALDLTFGSRGTAAVNPANQFKETRAVVVQPDGKVVLAGAINTCTILWLYINPL